MQSPWLRIPLADYEAHMASASVDQAKLIADLFAGVLKKYKPGSVAVIGCAGGNGFDRIDPNAVSRVVAVDINPDYLAATARRHAGKFDALLLKHADIETADLDCPPVDLCFAALVFEYVDVTAALKRLWPLCRAEGYLVAVLQLPSADAGSITPTSSHSILSLAGTLKLVDPSVLESAARDSGFVLLDSAKATSSVGKQFAIHVYRRPPVSDGQTP